MAATRSPLFSDLVTMFGPRIDAALDVRTALGDGCPARLREAMRYSLLAPGKRLRPMLVLLAAEACSGETDAAMPAACAVEMIHAYSLIHDDLPTMDDDDLRRGRPTCHKAFGEAVAILAGDALLTLAFEVLAKEIQPPSVAAACCAALAQAAGACNMVGGQADDMDREEGSGVRGQGSARIWDSSGTATPETTVQLSSQHDVVAQPQDNAIALLESIHHRKTGAMIQVSLRLGGLVVDADSEQLAALGAYGLRLGLAFQITDDLLDVQSTETDAGKRVGKDAKRGKLTFPGLLGLDQSTQHAEQLIAEACQAVGRFGASAEGLRTLAGYVLERNR